MRCPNKDPYVPLHMMDPKTEYIMRKASLSASLRDKDVSEHTC